MDTVVYIVIGRTNDATCETWTVMAYADEAAAIQHRDEATAAAQRVHQNIQRATSIRGKPFSPEKLARFAAGNKPDPAIRFSEHGVSYVVQRSALAPGLALQTGY